MICQFQIIYEVTDVGAYSYRHKTLHYMDILQYSLRLNSCSLDTQKL